METRATRADIQLVVSVKFEDSGAFARGVSQNLSETGVLVRSSLVAPRGTIARLEFKEFNGAAEVIWKKEPEEGPLLGMRFISMGRKDRRVLNRLIEYAGEERR